MNAATLAGKFIISGTHARFLWLLVLPRQTFVIVGAVLKSPDHRPADV